MLILWEHFKTKMKNIGPIERMLHCVKIDKLKKMTLYLISYSACKCVITIQIQFDLTRFEFSVVRLTRDAFNILRIIAVLKLNSVWFKINRRCVITVQIWFDSTD